MVRKTSGRETVNRFRHSMEPLLFSVLFATQKDRCVLRLILLTKFGREYNQFKLDCHLGLA
jgi:hypothetical protein